MNALRYCFVIYILSGSILCELSKCTLNPDHTEEICNGGGSFYRIESCRERWDISVKFVELSYLFPQTRQTSKFLILIFYKKKSK